MKAPTRLKYDDALPARARELLATAPRPRHITHEERRRAVERTAALASLPIATSLLFWAKGVAVASVVAIGLVAGGQLMRTDAARTKSVAPVATMRATVSREVAAIRARTPVPDIAAAASAPPFVGPPVAEPASEPRAPHPRSALTAPSAPPPEVPKDDVLAREANLLETARESLERDPARALAALDAHARDFPTGQLAPEREVLRVDALRRLGRTSEAAARGNAILSEGSSRLYQERVRTLLDGGT